MRSKSTGAHRHQKGIAPSTHKASEDPGRLTLDSELGNHRHLRSGKNNKSQLGDLSGTRAGNVTVTIEGGTQNPDHKKNQASSNSYLNLSSRQAKSKGVDKLIKKNLR